MTKKAIWIGAEDLTQDQAFLERSEKEFAELSLESVATEEQAGGWAASRRDFLKLMGFGLGAATVAAACETPVRKVMPYVTKPQDIVPGIANYYASSFVDGGDYCAVLVKTREGRPIKIEGNSISSVTKGGTSARAQAMVLSLYDTKRIKSAGTVSKDGVQETSWADLDSKVKRALASGTTYLFAGTMTSPSENAALAELKAKYPGLQVVKTDPVSASAMLQANAANFGIAALPNYQFDKAKVIVSFGADFLGTWVSPVQFAHDYSKTRKVTGKGSKMSRHIQVESFMSLTGSNADNRIQVKPSEQGVAIAHLYNAVAAAAGGASVSAPALANEKAKASLTAVATELLAARGASLVVSGSNNNTEQMLVNGINAMLGNIGNTVDFSRTNNMRQGNEKELAAAVAAMKSGGVGAVIVYGCNPAYETADQAGFMEAFGKVPLRVSLNTTLDETTVACTHVAPTHHVLESWGDVEPVSGLYSLIQPTIAPLFKTRQAGHSFLAWADSANLQTTAESPYYEYVKSYWMNNMSAKQTKYASKQAFWDMALHDGVFETAAAPRVVNYSGAGVDGNNVTKPSGTELEIAFYETVNVGGGQHAHNPWLQEMPDPVTRTVWGNYLHIPNEWDGINKISGWKGLSDGDLVEVGVNGQTITVPVIRTFGLAPGTVALAMGYGRTSGGSGVGYGASVNGLLPKAGENNQYFAGNVTVNPTGKTEKDFSCVQYHHTMGVTAMGTKENAVINVDEKALGWNGFQGSLTDRSIIKHTTLDELPTFLGDLKEFREEADHLNQQSLYPDYSKQYTAGVHWSMHVDMSACIGCGACQVACVAENNVPVVGKHEVHRHHEMTWLRIDRYFYGDFENPNVVYQPMMCQHCENAPCENVCPVNASNHSMEGLNQMAYNRCIGTRYCANNCPYKVRRFNWLDYTTADLWGGNEEGVFQDNGKPFYSDNLTRMVLNPDVTVRTRGVIEKCSFCIQRIQEGKLTAKKEQRIIEDNDIRSACQTACPTGAITFGNINNPKSAVSKKFSEPVTYKVLEEINVRPNVMYSAKVKNPAKTIG
jgi:MoCo/4Fe-4S cofactor protein with predicted Tat translocation signal